ncbi:PEGA domain-containing protein [bacterium]|nr:PEGA domain-containing protein [bacterium]
MNSRKNILVILAIIICSLIFLCVCMGNNGEDPHIGTVNINSQPSGATIILNAECTNHNTPYTLDLEEGEYSFNLSLYIYDLPPETTLSVKGGESYTIDFELDSALHYGILEVSSNPPGVEIVINCHNTGFLTPGMVLIPVGTHQVWVHRDGFQDSEPQEVTILENDTLELSFSVENPRKKVLLEDFTNVSCNPCGDVDPYLESLERNYDGELIIISYHVSWPSPTDPMFLNAPSENNARVSFYNVLNAPNVFIDGELILENVDDTANLVPSVEEKLALPAQIALWGEVLGDSALNLTAFSEVDYQGKLYVALLEKQRSFENPPGSNGLTEFKHIIRRFLPNHQGTEVNLTPGEENLHFSYVLPADLTLQDIIFVAFLQDETSKEIVQVQSINP